MGRCPQDAAFAEIGIGQCAGQRLSHPKQTPGPLTRGPLDRLRILGSSPKRRHRLRSRQAEELTRLVCNVSEVDEATGLPDEIKQIAELAGRRVRPPTGARTGQMHVERPTLVVADIADQPIVAGTAAGGEIVAADRFRVLREAARQIGGGKHDRPPSRPARNVDEAMTLHELRQDHRTLVCDRHEETQLPIDHLGEQTD